MSEQPYHLPTNFEWYQPNLESNDLDAIYNFLNKNYVEDAHGTFRFDYAPEFLKWALMPPDYKPEWHIVVRVKSNHNIVGFITAIPVILNIQGKKEKAVKVNFLCVHKKLRSKRLAPLLIKEITRRVNLYGVYQAIYTSGTLLPNPIASCRYYHRSLNPKKLVYIGYASLTKNMTMARTLKLYSLPSTPLYIRPMEARDIPAVTKLLSDYLSNKDVYPEYNEDEIKHWFMPKENIVYSFVVQKQDRITDFVSFYVLPSSILNHPKHKILKSVYGFYNVSTQTLWKDLITDALIMAKQLGFDVYNVLDIMDNKEFLKDCKFQAGNGLLKYYIWSQRDVVVEPKNLGIVLF